MRCLFCNQELNSSNKKFCNISCKGYYHRYFKEYPQGFTPEIANFLKARTKTGRKTLAPDDKMYPINIPIHENDFHRVNEIDNTNVFLRDELKLFVLLEGKEIAEIIEDKVNVISNRSKDYKNYTIYIPKKTLEDLDAMAARLMRTRRNLLTIFSIHTLTRN